jgi:toxin ParE1/3/4
VVQEIKWTNRALQDLQEIYEFIARDSLRYAQIQIESIQDVVSNLQKFPLMGHILQEFPHLPYREILADNYRVLYKYDKSQKRIYIMAVIHGKRLLRDNLPINS